MRKLSNFDTLDLAQKTYVVQKTDRAWKFSGPWTTTWSEQYLSAVHPWGVGWSEYGICLKPLNFEVLGGNDP